jgi:hypothetical protein
MANSKTTRKREKQTTADDVFVDAIPAYADLMTDSNALALGLGPAVATVNAGHQWHNSSSFSLLWISKATAP